MARGPGERAGLSRPAVVAAARDLLSADAPLSMRSLAARLGVAPNTLYSHVGSKAELLDEVLDDVLAAVPDPDLSDDPADVLVGIMTATYDVLLAHPRLVPIYLQRQGARGSQARRLGALMDSTLSRAGVPPTRVAQVRTVLVVHALGFAAFAVAGEGRPVPLREDLVRSLRWLLDGAAR